MTSVRWRVCTMPRVELEKRFKDLEIEVELGFSRPNRRFKKSSVASIATCRPSSRTALCIECDACIDVCPVDCLTITVNGEEEELRKRLKVATLDVEATDVRVRTAQADRSGHGQGRECLRSLRVVRRALPHRCLGHAEVHAIRMPYASDEAGGSRIYGSRYKKAG